MTSLQAKSHLNPVPLRPMSHPEERDICVENETSADAPNPNTLASPAHLPASEFQLLTPSFYLLQGERPPTDLSRPRIFCSHRHPHIFSNSIAGAHSG